MDILTLKSDNEIYQGQVNNNIKTGYGKLWNNEYSYYGNFNNDKFDGKGLLEYNNDKLFKKYDGAKIIFWDPEINFGVS